MSVAKLNLQVGSSQLWRCFRRCCRTLSHKRRRCRFGLILLNVPVPRIHMSEKSANRRSAPSVQTRGHGVRRSYRQCFTSDTFSLLGRLIVPMRQLDRRRYPRGLSARRPRKSMRLGCCWTAFLGINQSRDYIRLAYRKTFPLRTPTTTIGRITLGGGASKFATSMNAIAGIRSECAAL
jgi:hypothetical protein